MSSENGEAQNETPTESDKMDISEVSDQVSPVSDQSPSEVVDNSTVKKHEAQSVASLDNAAATTTTTSTTLNTTNPTRDRLDSALSLEGLDLELPTLDSYQEEFVDFPSSPKQLKECLEAHGLAMPQERDSGTMGRSEEEDEEDTSIYQAVLSPDCQDVRLKKDLDSTNMEQHDANENPSNLENHANNKQEIMDENENEEQSNKAKSTIKKILTPNPEDIMLPNLYGNRAAIKVLPDMPVTPTNLIKAASSHNLKTWSLQQNGSSNAKSRSQSTMDLRLVNDINEDEFEEDSNFIFERRNSKRLAKKEFGGRVVEGLFVESPLIKDESSASKLGLRKIAVPQSLQNFESPVSDDSPTVFSNSSSRISDLEGEEDSHKKRLTDAEFEFKTPNPKNKFTTAAEVHRDSDARPVPRVRTNLAKTYSAPSSTSHSFRSPPCPKPRRKLKNGNSDRGPTLVLDPVALQHCTPSRGAPNINPDGSVEIRKERPGSLVAPQRGGRRRIRVSADILTSGSAGDTTADGDESSAESRLSDTDMMSPDDDPDLDALLSPDLDTPDEMEDSIMERLGEPPPEPAPIPELSAAEERAEARSWRSVVVAGLERRIDMKVIEPYKRVLSHGGYLSSGSRNAIIVFSACFLPDRSRVDYDYVMDNLFLYVLTTLDQLITEDYVLIYLHGATSRGCMPTFSWLKRCYQMIDRRLRKNLKGLYLVHPTFWLKTIVIMTRPFISSKFSRKLSFVDSLAELSDIVPLEQASIPDRVKQLDYEQQMRYKKRKGRFW